MDKTGRADTTRSRLLMASFKALKYCGYSVFDIAPDPITMSQHPDGIAWREGHSVIIYCIANHEDWSEFCHTDAWLYPELDPGNLTIIAFTGNCVPLTCDDRFMLFNVIIKDGLIAKVEYREPIYNNGAVRFKWFDIEEMETTYFWSYDNRIPVQSINETYLFFSLWTMTNSTLRKRYHYFPAKVKWKDSMFPSSAQIVRLTRDLQGSKDYIRDQLEARRKEAKENGEHIYKIGDGALKKKHARKPCENDKKYNYITVEGNSVDVDWRNYGDNERTL